LKYGSLNILELSGPVQACNGIAYCDHYGNSDIVVQPLRETGKLKGKAIPLQACRGPEDSRRLRLPDFKTIGT